MHSNICAAYQHHKKCRWIHHAQEVGDARMYGVKDHIQDAADSRFTSVNIIQLHNQKGYEPQRSFKQEVNCFRRNRHFPIECIKWIWNAELSNEDEKNRKNAIKSHLTAPTFTCPFISMGKRKSRRDAKSAFSD